MAPGPAGCTATPDDGRDVSCCIQRGLVFQSSPISLARGCEWLTVLSAEPADAWYPKPAGRPRVKTLRLLLHGNMARHCAALITCLASLFS